LSVVAGNVKRLIQERGIKQKFVADRAGMGDSMLSMKLNDLVRFNEDDIVRLCTALGVEPNELFKNDSQEKDG